MHFTLRQNANVKKTSFGQNKRSKKVPLFSFVTPTHHSFAFKLQFLNELRHKVRLYTTVCGIFYF